MKTKSMHDTQNYVIAIVFILLLVVLSSVAPQFRTTRNMLSMLRQTSFVGIMAVGATFVILSGGIDLSVGSMLALSGMICARLLRQFGVDAYTAVFLTLLAGALMGYLNGVLVNKLGIPPFIVTFSTMGIFRGLVFLMAFRELGYIQNVPLTDNVFLAIGGGRIGKVYNPIVFFVVVAILGILYLRNSKFGTYVYAVGSNEQSAAMSGVNVERVRTQVYVLSGICAALSGILWTSRLMTTTTEMGLGNELDVIAAIVVGGTSIMGGRGSVGKTVVGALFIGTLTNGLSMLGVPAFYQPLAKALLIVSAAYLDNYLLKRYTEQSRRHLIAVKSSRDETPVLTGERTTFDPSEIALDIQGISKRFGEIQVLKNVSLKIAKGEVHALVGENGAGKSTLIKIMTGVHQKNAGQILLHGKPVTIKNPHHAQSLGISAVFQELSLIPSLSVAKNILLGREPHSLPGIIHHAKLRQRAEAVLQELKFNLPLHELSERLSVGNKQEVEIAKAFSQDASIVILDEPTASLSAEEKIKLFDTIRKLSAKGVSILFISHILDEVLEISHTVTVLRNGEIVTTSPAEDLDKAAIVRYMVGRELAEQKIAPAEKGAPVLEVNGLTREGSFADISFSLCRGEILGLTGLVGSGRSELARAIFGLDAVDAGDIWLHQQPVQISSPAAAMKHGIAFLSEDRKNEGLVMIHSMMQNISMAHLGAVSTHGILHRAQELTLAREYVNMVDIRPPDPHLPVSGLSGGNQQKVVLSKWLCRNPQVLIVDEPTVGIDVGAKHEIYNILHGLAEQGVAILLISSDFAEILRMSQRILTMRHGRIVLRNDAARDQISQETLMKAAIGRGES
ncbi:hypothetical protein CSB45_14030 [candidate division KSB3 bacterium]|uniref:ABC transporter domain-containing protein n=1 Tax=candidate division KSB3 bacterium TaxID=2044937 RepID=A0A2G6E179_9BACT|nr:MAG: hypothetical protein CSB45_14030 [candidate division KSB3 bacterium]PIE28444.1 MAG: hypothetical protein CSA57_13675 [candidate division KSB3 bacterium]